MNDLDCSLRSDGDEEKVTASRQRKVGATFDHNVLSNQHS
jgi:hypothetical protein